MTRFKMTAFVLAAALPGMTLAQTATTTTPPAAAPAMSGSATMPTSIGQMDDAAITSQLQAAGYTDIKMARDGGKVTVDAMRDGKPTNLVYDLTTGALTTVDGAGYAIKGAAPNTATGTTTDAGTMGTTDANSNAGPESGTGQNGNNPENQGSDPNSSSEEGGDTN